MEIVSVAFDVHLPAGVAGPAAMNFDVRCFLIPHADGLSLLDTGVAGSAAAIGTALTRLGATWDDVSDIVLSHDHPDHVGSLDEVIALAPHAAVWGNSPLSTQSLADGDSLRNLRVLSTPGHTAGHVSLLHGEGTLLVGDLVGSHNGQLQRAPAPFTADPSQAEESIRKIARINALHMLFGHGAEIDQPQTALQELLDV
ncbi:glyoxylase-like metal-dependent hydrolase (beta-lactamase superfamily II) [Jatrophihabitans sp. GAS493]|uniref:MBL fold metallo-hydrolase n=1 Tax=Jatrophihabitans sp. GAS493 TaxID=1907575 RepID=UPI000BC0D25C|nr:MBL fold metallo-hydrolase [Jatrophihabitans sp. GAS493]SOD72529.1 glyoxylase-like metal-dependent hydrolase (beta-lactamase superfamily II) [Jatrophihabitans sp. GAS493]